MRVNVAFPLGWYVSQLSGGKFHFTRSPTFCSYRSVLRATALMKRVEHLYGIKCRLEKLER